MGRTSLIMVVAFNLIFMSMGFRLSSLTSSAYSKYSTYHSIEQAGLSAESGANIAISNAFFGRAVAIPSAAFSSGTGINGTIQITKIPIFGAAGTDTIGFNLRIIGEDDKSRVITRIIVQGASFSRWGMFTLNEGGIFWTSGDTCYGPFHTQDNINTNGTPRFLGQVTTNGRLISQNGTPYFKFPYTPNTNIPLDGNFIDLKSYGMGSGGRYIKGLDTYVQFLSNGQVTVHLASSGTASEIAWANTSSATITDGATPSHTMPQCTTYASVAALTSSGVLLVEDAQLHIKGKLNGQITLGCIDSKLSNGNNSGLSSVYIDSSLTYHDPPPGHQDPPPVSNDLLGIVSTNNILVSQYINHDNSTTTKSGKTTNDGTLLTNVTINATMYSSDGGFGAEGGGSRPSSGMLNLVGGIQERNRVAVGSTGGNGFLKSYDYDRNLQYKTPKGYPLTRFLIQNWVDSTVIRDRSFWLGENALEIAP